NLSSPAPPPHPARFARRREYIVSPRVVEDDAQRVPAPGAQAADAVAHIHAIITLRTFRRPVMHRERHRVSLPERRDLDPALHPRALLCHDESAAGKI